MYNRSQPSMYRGNAPQPTRTELYAALQRAQQDNQHLRRALAGQRDQSDENAQLRQAIAAQRDRQGAVTALREANALLSAEAAKLREENARLSAVSEQRPPAPDAQERVVRLSADIANLRRRHAEELARARRSAKAELIVGFVETLDVLERALAADPNPDSAWHQGTAGVQRQMLATLKRAGVERLGAVGEPFDPHIHEAIGLDPDAGVPPEHVAQVLQPGYRFAESQTADALIRPARVIVAG